MDCLVTKLKGTVNNPNLLKLGEARLEFLIRRSQLADDDWDPRNSIKAGDSAVTLTVLGPGMLHRYNASEEDVKTKVLQPGSDDYSFEIVDGVAGETQLSIMNKYGIARFTNSDFKFHTDFLRYSDGLERLLDCTGLQPQQRPDTQVWGEMDIEDVLKPTVKVLSFYGSPLEATLTQVASVCTGLTGLVIRSCGKVSGSIMDLVSLPSLASVNCEYSTLITGSVAAFNNKRTELGLGSVTISYTGSGVTA